MELTGPVYIFLDPDAGADRVSFYLDDPGMAGTPFQVENNAPFDFAGGSATVANPLDTSSLAPGEHTVTALVETFAGGAYTLTKVFTVPGGEPALSAGITLALMVSASADRSASAPLAGQELAGNVFIFLARSGGGTVSRVRFYLDDPAMAGAPTQTENNAPWDFRGGSAAAANPFGASSLSPGEHTVTARVETSSGVYTITRTFIAPP